MPQGPSGFQSPYNQGYQAPQRQMNSGGMGARQSMFQQPQQQQQKQGGGFWRGLGNAIKAPFTGGGSTTNNYYGGGQQMPGNRFGQMQGGFGRAFGGGMNRGMNQGGQMNPQMGPKPPMGQGQPQWNPTNMFTPGTSSEYLNRANVNPWMGNAPGMQPGGPEAGMPKPPGYMEQGRGNTIPTQTQAEYDQGVQQNQQAAQNQPMGPSPEAYNQMLQARGMMGGGGYGVQGGPAYDPNSGSNIWGPNGEWRGR